MSEPLPAIIIRGQSYTPGPVHDALVKQYQLESGMTVALTTCDRCGGAVGYTKEPAEALHQVARETGRAVEILCPSCADAQIVESLAAGVPIAVAKPPSAPSRHRDN